LAAFREGENWGKDQKREPLTTTQRKDGISKPQRPKELRTGEVRKGLDPLGKKKTQEKKQKELTKKIGGSLESTFKEGD